MCDTGIEKRNKFLSENHGLLWCAALQWAKHYGREVDDVLELVYEAALKCYSKYDPKRGKFGALLNYHIRHEFAMERIAKNAQRRSKYGEVHIAEKEEYEEQTMQIPDSTNVEEECVNGDYWQWAMSKLTDTQKRVLTLLYREGLGLTEAAKRLGMTKQGVDGHNRRALAKLKEYVGGSE